MSKADTEPVGPERHDGGSIMRRILAVITVLAVAVGGSAGVTRAGDRPASIAAGLQAAPFESVTEGPIVASGTLTKKDGAKASGWVALLAWPAEQVLRDVLLDLGKEQRRS